MKASSRNKPNADNPALTNDPSFSKSRRIFLKMMGIGAAAFQGSAAFGQHLNTCPENADWLIEKGTQLQDAVSFKFFRAEDLLHLELSFSNFELKGNQLQRKSGGSAYLVVTFPPQSLAEQAYLEAENPANNEKLTLPARTYLSEESRLVYEIPSSVKNIQLTAKDLLDWARFELKVNKRASAPGIIIPWTSDDEKPIEFKPITPIVKDTVQKPIFNRRETQPVEQKQETQQNPVLQKPIRIIQPTRQDTAKTINNNLNRINRVTNKEEQQQVVVTQVPPKEVQRQEMQKDPGITAVFQNLFVGKTPKPPELLETSVEFPWRLFVSPSNISAWAHTYELKLADAYKGKPVSVYELWHTRLATKSAGKVLENEVTDKLKTLRAMWGVDICADYKNVPSSNDSFFRTSLNNRNRHMIVHESSNWGIPKFTPKAAQVKNMMLSALGGWLDAEMLINRTDLEAADLTGYLNLLKWKHIATMARDHYVEVVEAGNIFPFGHQAVLIKITERKPEAGYAVNRQRKIVVITEEEKRYNPYAKNKAFLSFPFNAIRFITTASPIIDNTVAYVNGQDADENFIVKVAGRPYEFKMLGTDSTGHEFDFSLPVVFISSTASGKDNSGFLNNVIAEYKNTNKKPEKEIDTSADIRGQKVAYARSFIPGDTSYETESLFFGAQINSDELCYFSPRLDSAAIHEQSSQALTNTRDAISIELVDDNNKGMVFAKILGAPTVNFNGNSDKTGGSIAPNFALTGLSKLQGAFGGAVDDMKKLSFNPSSFFGGADDMAAKLFGVVKLSDLMKLVDMNPSSFINNINNAVSDIEKLQDEIISKTEQKLMSEVDALQKKLEQKKDDLINIAQSFSSKIPVLKTFKIPGASCTQYVWKGETKAEYSPVGGILTFKSNKPAETIQIETLLKRPENGDTPEMTATSSINDFSIILAKLIAIDFEKVSFGISSKIKADVNIVMKKEPMRFLGPLAFINQLHTLIPSDGFSDPPFLDITSEGVVTGYTLAVPDVQIGVFTLRNITLGAKVTLPFTGAPLSMRFNFCEKHQPFTLTVSMFGGGGFFAMELDLKGLRMIEAALEFGAAVSIDLGVASGAVSVMGGIYFAMKFDNGNTIVELTGYVRINGALSVLGLITVSLEFYLGLTYLDQGGKGNLVYGEASLKVKVEILFFSKTVSIKTRKEFAGSAADPTFAMLVEEPDWHEYCEAFAH